MKRCPTCRRDYYDDSLLYCLDDGAQLLDGPASASGPDEPPTAILPGHVSAASLGGLRHQPSSATSADSIAVLPFLNMSADPENEYFCDGLAEELLNAMSRIDGLKVAARTSSFSYKNRGVNVEEIGRALGVKTVLEGSVRKSSNQLRITVQLVNTADGYQLWSGRYDREMSDIFKVQDEIALAVIDALRVKLFATQEFRFLGKSTVNSEAFDLYLRAKALWNRATLPGLEAAIKYLESAIELDPNYALAYLGLAECYWILAYFEWTAPSEIAPKAKTAIEKAISLAPDLAECQTAMGAYKTCFEFDFGAAEAAYLVAISINPNDPQAHYLYSSVLMAVGRSDEAIEQGRIAVGLDPLSPIAYTTLARALCYARRYEEALNTIHENIEIAPEFWFFQWILGVIYAQSGRPELSLKHFRAAVKYGGFRIYSYLGVALIRNGLQDQARGLVDELKAAAANEFVSPIAAAVMEAELENMDLGLRLLEDAWKLRVVHLMWAGVDHVYDVFRGQPKFQEICRSVGLP